MRSQLWNFVIHQPSAPISLTNNTRTNIVKPGDDYIQSPDEYVGCATVRLLTKGGKLIYAIGRLGSSSLLSLIDLATFWMYLDYFILGGLLTGVAFAIGKLVIAFFGWYFGYLSDVTVSERWGRRRPYIFAGSLLLAFSTIMLFVPDYFIAIGNQLSLFLAS